jgi:hypothetical protein
MMMLSIVPNSIETVVGPSRRHTSLPCQEGIRRCLELRDNCNNRNNASTATSSRQKIALGKREGERTHRQWRCWTGSYFSVSPIRRHVYIVFPDAFSGIFSVGNSWATRTLFHGKTAHIFVLLAGAAVVQIAKRTNR